MLLYICESCGKSKPREKMAPIQIGQRPHNHAVATPMGQMLIHEERDEDAFYEYFEYCLECAIALALCMKATKKSVKESVVVTTERSHANEV